MTSCRSFGAAALRLFPLLALWFACAAVGAVPSPAKPASPRGAVGTVLEYEEAPGARILYLEQKGGLVSPLPPPVEGSRREPLPEFGSLPKAPAARAPAPRVPAARVPAAKKP